MEIIHFTLSVSRCIITKDSIKLLWQIPFSVWEKNKHGLIATNGNVYFTNAVMIEFVR